MMRIGRLLAMASLVGCATVAPSSRGPAIASVKTPHGCGDLLAEAGRKPPRLAYVRCTYHPDRQGKPVRAVYRVRGVFAAKVETDLSKSVGLVRLQRSCCQWDGPPAAFVDARGRALTISMISGETPVTDRTQWRDIASFEVVVETLTEQI